MEDFVNLPIPMQALPDIDIDIDINIDNGRHAQSDFICLANALHSSIGQTIIQYLYSAMKSEDTEALKVS